MESSMEYGDSIAWAKAEGGGKVKGSPTHGGSCFWVMVALPLAVAAFFVLVR